MSGKIAAALLVLAVSTLAFEVDYIGSFDDGLKAPTALAVGAQYIAVLEPINRQLKIFTPDGVIRQKINIEGDASGLVGIDDHTYLFCDRSRRQVVAVDIISGSTFDYLPLYNDLSNPVDIKKSGDMIYILDAGLSAIIAFNLQTQQSSSTVIRNDMDETIIFASSFALDGERERFYILDQVNSRIWIVDPNGSFIGYIGSFGNDEGQLTRGGSIICGQDGTIYVTDRYQGRVLAFDSEGEFISNIDLVDMQNDRLVIPIGLAIDSDNILYVASTESARIHVFRITGSSDTQAYFTELIYPSDGETISPDKVHLTAQVEVIGNPLLVTGIDFELYLKGGASKPVYEAENLPPDDLSDIENGIIVSEWHLSEILMPDTSYIWRARVRTDTLTQPWTDSRKFYTSNLLPDEFQLAQNYPNPFNPVTRIKFSLPLETEVQLVVYNVLGQQVKTLLNKHMEAGIHEIDWDGNNEFGRQAASGIYFYRLIAEDFTESRKMVLMR